jgi:hypothetical protein
MIEVDWRVLFIDFINDQKLPSSVDQKALKLHASLGEARVMFWLETSCTSVVLQQASL